MVKQYSSVDNAIRLFLQLQDKKNEHLLISIKDKIHTNFLVLTQLYEQLEKLSDGNKDSKIEPYIRVIEEKTIEFSRMEKEMDESFLLFIMGMGKMGKSTLINALVGEKLAEENVLPSTWKIDIYKAKKKQDDLVEVVYKNNKESNYFTLDEAKKYIKLEEEKTKKSKEEKSKEYREKQEKYRGNIEALKELQQELNIELSKISSNISEIRWCVKSNQLLDNFTVVDTPGLKQKLFGSVTESASDYYYKSDGALWIIDANKLSSKEQLSLIDEFPTKKNKVICVINRIDLVKKTGGEEAIAQVLNEANRIYGDKFCSIVPISAKEAIDGIVSGDEELINRSGIKHLISEVNRCFLSNAKTIKIKSKLDAMVTIVESVGIQQNHLLKELKEVEEERVDLLNRVNSELQKVSDGISNMISSKLNNYKKDVQSNIESNVETLFEEENPTTRNEFIENTIFKANSFNILINDIKRNVHRELTEFEEHYKKESIIEKYKYLREEDRVAFKEHNTNLGFEAYKSQTVDFNTENLDMASTVGFSMIGAFILGPIGLVLGGIANSLGITKYIAMKMKIPKVKQDMENQLDKLIENVQDELLSSLDEKGQSIINKLDTIRETSFRQNYCDSNNVDAICDCIELALDELETPIEALSVKDILFS